MLISTDKRFILLSPAKVASSSVGALLSPLCDIRIGTPMFGKHEQITEVVERYKWMFDLVKLKEFKIFLLFRDPIERAASLYVSHLKTDFDGDATSTKNMPLRVFASKWISENTWMSMPQFLHGLLRASGFRVDYLIRSNNLVNDLTHAFSLIDVEVDSGLMVRSNESPIIENRTYITEELRPLLREFYVIDQMLFDKYAGQEITEREKNDISLKIVETYGHWGRDRIQGTIHDSIKNPIIRSF